MSTIDPRLLTTGGAAANETRDETEGDDKGTDDSEGDSGDDNEEGRYKVGESRRALSVPRHACLFLHITDLFLRCAWTEKIKDYEVYEIEKEPVSIEEDRYVVLYRVKWEGYDNPLVALSRSILSSGKLANLADEILHQLLKVRMILGNPREISIKRKTGRDLCEIAKGQNLPISHTMPSSKRLEGRTTAIERRGSRQRRKKRNCRNWKCRRKRRVRVRVQVEKKVETL
jgi:hypothetical protein